MCIRDRARAFAYNRQERACRLYSLQNNGVWDSAYYDQHSVVGLRTSGPPACNCEPHRFDHPILFCTRLKNQSLYHHYRFENDIVSTHRLADVPDSRAKPAPERRERHPDRRRVVLCPCRRGVRGVRHAPVWKSKVQRRFNSRFFRVSTKIPRRASRGRPQLSFRTRINEIG